MHEKAEAFIRWIEEMKEKLDIPAYPEMVREEDIDRIAEWTEEEIGFFSPVPVIRDRKQLREFIVSLLPGSAKPEESVEPEANPEPEERAEPEANPEPDENADKGEEHDH